MVWRSEEKRTLNSFLLPLSKLGKARRRWNSLYRPFGNAAAQAKVMNRDEEAGEVLVGRASQSVHEATHIAKVLIPTEYICLPPKPVFRKASRGVAILAHLRSSFNETIPVI
jgi:hypothetical protein